MIECLGLMQPPQAEIPSSPRPQHCGRENDEPTISRIPRTAEGLKNGGAPHETTE
jgi:hypothetical protein